MINNIKKERRLADKIAAAGDGVPGWHVRLTTALIDRILLDRLEYQELIPIIEAEPEHKHILEREDLASSCTAALKYLAEERYNLADPLTVYYKLDMSYREIGDICGVSSQNIHQKIRSAIGELCKPRYSLFILLGEKTGTEEIGRRAFKRGYDRGFCDAADAQFIPGFKAPEAADEFDAEAITNLQCERDEYCSGYIRGHLGGLLYSMNADNRIPYLKQKETKQIFREDHVIGNILMRANKMVIEDVLNMTGEEFLQCKSAGHKRLIRAIEIIENLGLDASNLKKR